MVAQSTVWVRDPTRDERPHGSTSISNNDNTNDAALSIMKRQLSGILSLCLLVSFLSLTSIQKFSWLAHALSPSTNSRRDFVFSTTMAAISTTPLIANAAMPLPLPSTGPRNVDVGAGFDLLREGGGGSMPFDVLYPPSMEGLWVCRRVPTSVEGDLFQAQEVWKALGGISSLALTTTNGKGSNINTNNPETYLTRFLKPQAKESEMTQAGVVNDRGFELLQRRKQSPQEESPEVIWTVDQPNELKYSINNSNDRIITLSVRSRTVELPSDTKAGFGFNELISIEEGRREGGRLASLAGANVRAAQIKRRFRRSYDEQGNRVVEGLELIRTFRALDGVAGTEFPTSTVKSQLRFVRPPSPVP